ncbi:MAG: hypothetical protein RDU83_00445 [bacterium]|nr:hypothetical protein [bacterium]
MNYSKEVMGVEKLRLPVKLDAIYSFLLGLAMLSPSLAASVFGHEVKDPGLLLTLSGLFIGLGVLVWVIAGDIEKYGGLASALVFVLLISAVFLVWGWTTNLYTARTVLVPLIINIVLAIWIWSAKPKS